MNVLPAEVEGNAATVFGHTIMLAKSYRNLPALAKIEIGVRPEFLSVSNGRAGGSARRFPITSSFGRRWRPTRRRGRPARRSRCR